jgi:hypothetical protein
MRGPASGTPDRVVRAGSRAHAAVTSAHAAVATAHATVKDVRVMGIRE